MAYQAGIADDIRHLALIFHRFIQGAGIPAETLDGLHFVPNPANTGNGLVTRILGYPASVTETITITFTSPTVFTVGGSVTGALPGGTVGVPYVSTVIDFLISAGSIAWVAADVVTIGLTRSPLITAAPSQVWTVRSPLDVGTAGSSDQKQIYEGPGLAGADAILIGIDAPAGSVWHWRLIGMSSFNAANNFYEQVGYSGANSPVMNGWGKRSPYWMVATGRSFAVYQRPFGQYSGCSGGFLNPIALPAEWPYPLFVGGMNYAGWHFNENIGAPGPWWNPRAQSSGSSNTTLKIRDWASGWHGAANWHSTGIFDDNTANRWHTWPYWERRGNQAGEWARDLWGGMISGPKGEQFVMPITIIRDEGANQGILATLPHMYWNTSGENTWGNSDPTYEMLYEPDQGRILIPEDEILVGPDRFKVFPGEFNRMYRGKYTAAMKLE